MCSSRPTPPPPQVIQVPAPPPPPPEAEPNASPRVPVDARDEEQVIKKAKGKRSLRIDLNVPRSNWTGLNIPL